MFSVRVAPTFAVLLFASTYLTISKPAESLYKDRGSKFLGFAWPAASEQEIKMHLNELEKSHPSAAHHCYAWRLGADKTAFRINDDGEPSGSAGKPIYSQILSNDLTNILIVVVRYFGGSLLGVPGLISAYKTAAAEVIASAGIEEKAIEYEYEIFYSNDDTSHVMRVLKETGAKIISMDYKEQNEVIFHIRKDMINHLEDRLSELYKVKFKPLKLLA